jgi:hypothetical protein
MGYTARMQILQNLYKMFGRKISEKPRYVLGIILREEWTGENMVQ